MRIINFLIEYLIIYKNESHLKLLLTYSTSNSAMNYNIFKGKLCDFMESTCWCRRCRVAGLIPGLERYNGEGNSNPLQFSCLKNSMDRRARETTVCGITKSWTRLSTSAKRMWLYSLAGEVYSSKSAGLCGSGGENGWKLKGFKLWLMIKKMGWQLPNIKDTFQEAVSDTLWRVISWSLNFHLDGNIHSGSD